MKRMLAPLVLAFACNNAPDEIVTICNAATECGLLAADELDVCISELDAATPDSATRAASECAACMQTDACGEIAKGSCASECRPLIDTIRSVPGTVSGACSSSSLDNVAESDDRRLVIGVACPAFEERLFLTTSDHRKVGEKFGCGQMSFSLSGACEVPSAGTLEIVSRDGRRWVTGTCACGPEFRVTVNVPYVLGL